jgi:iron complex outermembrane recepter protein
MGLTKKLLVGVSTIALAGTFTTSVYAQSDDGAKPKVEELVVTGTRSKPRTTLDSPVPIDTFDAAALERQGNGDLTETLKNLVPSYSATALTGDGSAFVRSTSLRGLPPDDTLILVNSKRRHRSSLIAHFGAAMNAGAHAVDVGMIPSIALKNVEVLRDGAAAQYGSDAIAGVMNFILKDYDEGGELQAQVGQWYDGESEYKIAANRGINLGSDGFLNVSVEYTSTEQLSRGFQHSDAIGVPGAKNPAMNWGRPESSGFRGMYNAAIPIGNNGAEAYLFGNYADTTGRYSFFYRAPDKTGVLTPVPLDPTNPAGGNFCWCDTYPAGFTPFLDGDQTDFSQVAGIRGETRGGWAYDSSISFGKNRMEYTLHDTINPSWGPDSPSVFDIGDLEQRETNLNVDFSKSINDITHLAFGWEWREETYEMYVGDRASYEAGDWTGSGLLVDPVAADFYTEPGIGANGMTGTGPDAAGEFSRENWAVYADAEFDFSSDLLVQTAVRYEKFSDFGDTFNGKIAARYNVSDTVVLRGAISTGFRAPTPGQSNFTGIVTTFDGLLGIQTQEGTLPPTHPLAVANGGRALDAETSVNYSLGVAFNPTDNFSLTADVYRIDVEDRISKTMSISVVDPLFSSLAFYTNALETETFGFDIVALYEHTWSDGSSTDVSVAWNHNETDVTGQNIVGGILPVSAGAIQNIEGNLPEDRANVTMVHTFGKWVGTVRANYYGDTIDERSTNDPIGSEFIVDVEVSYDMTDNFTLMIGANNLLDEYPDRVPGRLSQGMPYPRRTPIGYNGGMAYVRGVYKF